MVEISRHPAILACLYSNDARYLELAADSRSKSTISLLEYYHCWELLAISPSLETGPPPSGQLNAGVRKEDGLARRPCRARTQECGHLQFEAMRVHTPLAVNMATYCKACWHYFLSVKYNRRLSSGVTASVVCAVILVAGGP